MKITIVLCFLLFFGSTHAEDHAVFTAILQQHVKDGLVNYSALKNDGRLATYLQDMSEKDIAKASPKKRLSFYINVYNAATLYAVADAWPVSSIRDIGGKASGSVWDKPIVRLRGKTISLNELENDIIRAMGDARIHYALVCAAKGCPPLRAKAYEAETLDATLDNQAQLYLRSAIGASVNHKTFVIRISRIFEWFRKDFGDTDQSVLASIAVYMPDADAAVLRSAKSRIEYLDYDWSINAR